MKQDPPRHRTALLLAGAGVVAAGALLVGAVPGALALMCRRNVVSVAALTVLLFVWSTVAFGLRAAFPA